MNKDIRKLLYFVTCSSAALVPFGAALHAQEAGAPSGETASSLGGDIVVTAQKRSEPLQRVPVSVSVVSAENLQTRAIMEPMQLAAAVPSLSMQGQPNQVSGIAYSIRGVGTAVYGNAVEASVSTVIDGISYGRPEMAAIQFFDIGQIEVLAGPQGMLFGKNASAGVVSITTNSPVLNELSGSMYASYGNQASPTAGHEVMVQGVINLPVTANSALRIAGFGSYRSGLIKNLNPNFIDRGSQGLTEYGIRAKYKIEVDDHLTIDIGGDVTREVGAGNSVWGNVYLAPGGRLEALTQTYAPALANPGGFSPYTADSNPKSYQFVASGAQANIGYEFDSGLRIDNLAGFRSYTNSTYGDIDHLPINVQDVNGGTIRDWQISDELKITSPDTGPLKYVAGLYYFQAGYDRTLITTGAGEGLGVTPAPIGSTYFSGQQDTSARLKSYAAYAQATLHVAGPLSVVGGLRFTHDDIESSGNQTSPNGVVPTYRPLGSFDYGTTKSNLSYRLGAQLQLTPMVMTYASYARGYKGPALASTPAVAFPVIRPEIPTAWEIGIKSSFLDRKVVFNVSAWYEKFRNFQAQATDIVTNFSGLLNAGSLISKGAEASLVVNPIRGLTLSGDVVYTDAYYGSFQGLPCYGGQPTGTSGVNVCLPNRTTDATGNRLANSSKWTYTLGADYSFEVAEDRTVKVGANWNYRSTTNFLAAGNPRTRQNGYGLLGGDIALSSKLNGWTLAVFGRNILNKHFYSFITQSPVDGFLGDSARGGNYAAFFSPDGIRTIGVSLRKSF